MNVASVLICVLGVLGLFCLSIGLYNYLQATKDEMQKLDGRYKAR